MAHRIITQVVFAGTRILGRAFAESWRQANAASRAAGNSSSSSSRTGFASSGITLDEACKILNVAPPKGGQADMETVMERFKKLFDLNDPGKGGSFYLQSKVLRARERIEMEMREAGERAEKAKEAEEGWKPKMYKDR